jgi:hypothetical protein
MADERPEPAAPRPRFWRRAVATAPAGRGREPTRQQRLFLVLAGIGTLLAVLVALLLGFRVFKPPFLLSLPVTAYDRPYPVNALARTDSDAFCALFKDHQQRLDSQERHLLQRELDDLARRPEPVVLVHLAALARPDGDGVALLPIDADPDEAASWVPLKILLDALRDCPARQKVLLLDIARPDADPHLGILADDTARRVRPVLEAAVATDRRLWVFLPSAPGQTALTSEELGQSVFGYYFAEGLRGRADGRKDRTITLDELAAYVAAHVDRWAIQNRGLRQTPVLLGDLAAARKVELARTRHLDGIATERPAEEPYPAVLLEGWKRRDDWRNSRVFAYAPGPFRELEATLLWAEQQWRGRNVAADAIESQLRRQIDALTSEKEAAEKAVSLPRQPHSLALAVALGANPPGPKEIEALGGLAKEAAQAKKAKEPAAALEALKPKLEAARKPFAGRPVALAWAAFEAAAGDIELDPTRLRFYRDFLAAEQPEAQYAETLSLYRLGEGQLDGADGQWPQDLVHLALKTAREREQAAACWAVRPGRVEIPTIEPRALPWVAKVFGDTVARHREGEDLLLKGGAASWDKAKQLLEQADQEYDGILRLVQAVARAHQLLEDAWTELPALAPYTMNLPQPGGPTDTDWARAVQAVQELSAFLAQPAREAPASTAEVSTVLAGVEQRRGALQGPLGGLRRHLLQEGPAAFAPDRLPARPNPALCLEADALLCSPLPPAPVRAALWKARHDLAETLCRRTLDDDQAEALGGAPPSPGPPDLPAGEQAEQERAHRRAAWVIDLLKVGGLDDLGKLEQEVRALGSGKPDAVPGVAGRLRQAWVKRLPDQILERLGRVPEKDDSASPDLIAADCLSRALHPFDRLVLRRRAKGALAPGARLRRAERHALWQWLGKIGLEEAQRLAREPLAHEFYARAAENYLDSLR